jgi:hypothetical protein
MSVKSHFKLQFYHWFENWRFVTETFTLRWW